MPSPTTPRNVSLRDFDGGGTWKPRRKTASGHPPRAKQLVELMTLGAPDGSRPAMTLPEAAAMGIKIGTARAYMHLPASRQYFMALCTSIREGEIPRNLMAAIEIRDSKKLKQSAAGARARIEASRYIESGGKDNAGININVGVGVGVNGGALGPGYVIEIAEKDVAGAQQVLRQARSTRSLLSDDGRESPASVIEHDGAETAPSPQSDSAASPGLQLFRGPVGGFAPLDSRRRRGLPDQLPVDET
jgi:hypothetical protein